MAWQGRSINNVAAYIIPLTISVYMYVTYTIFHIRSVPTPDVVASATQAVFRDSGTLGFRFDSHWFPSRATGFQGASHTIARRMQMLLFAT